MAYNLCLCLTIGNILRLLKNSILVMLTIGICLLSSLVFADPKHIHTIDCNHCTGSKSFEHPFPQNIIHTYPPSKEFIDKHVEAHPIVEPAPGTSAAAALKDTPPGHSFTLHHLDGSHSTYYPDAE